MRFHDDRSEAESDRRHHTGHYDRARGPEISCSESEQLEFLPEEHEEIANHRPRQHRDREVPTNRTSLFSLLTRWAPYPH